MNRTLDLLEFIDNSPTTFHAVNNIKNILLENGFQELKENNKWPLNSSGKYFVEKNNCALIAFEIGTEDVCKKGFRFISSHTDSPCIKIKPNPELIVESTYVKLNTEVYGGPILSTWFDKPLSIAGRVVVKDEHDNLIVKLVDIERPILTIPNLAIHFNRNVNEGLPINKQSDLYPLLALIQNGITGEDVVLKLLSEELEVDNILDFELFLYDYAKSQIIGLNDEFISAGKLDDLWMVHASLNALINTEYSEATKVAVFLDSEEIGSSTAEGAESVFLESVLKRIMYGLNKTNEDYYIALANSIMISADLAHGVHPNFMASHDPTNRPRLGNGPVIKYSAVKKYTTDAVSAAYIIDLCKKSNIPFQVYTNKSDVVGGSTMARFFATKFSIPVVDIGAPILAMHSVRELGSVLDVEPTERLFKAFFSN